MNRAKFVLLACPVLLASVLVVANPAQASTGKSAPTTPVVRVGSAQQISESVALSEVTKKTNPIREQLGCGCTSCVNAQNQLQGKLPPTLGF